MNAFTYTRVPDLAEAVREEGHGSRDGCLPLRAERDNHRGGLEEPVENLGHGDAQGFRLGFWRGPEGPAHLRMGG